ncbi:hypothetical protein F4780DRAFT_776073 [Xylariomycetidae sp. FL0641]|nr:hypothetical protein F4780DRAFT_776073 [Xylariomycetidae sp. FL0641]
MFTWRPTAYLSFVCCQAGCSNKIETMGGIAMTEQLPSEIQLAGDATDHVGDTIVFYFKEGSDVFCDDHRESSEQSIATASKIKDLYSSLCPAVELSSLQGISGVEKVVWV